MCSSGRGGKSLGKVFSSHNEVKKTPNYKQNALMFVPILESIDMAHKSPIQMLELWVPPK
jgi:hypothetical protein